MAAEDPQTPPPPSLVAPRDAAAVYGEEATFVWDPVEEAEAYRLQIAPTARFENPVVDAEVGAETAVTVGHQLPTDGQTFFWRVLAGSDAGWGEGGPVESFIATTEAEAEQERPGPRGGEEPVTGLARAARHEDSVETFRFEDRFEKEKERGVAYEGVAASQILGIAVSIVVVVLVAVGVLFGWFEQVSQGTVAEAASRQQYGQLRQAELEAEKQLREYGVVDEEEGIYRIPIDRAMDLIATEEYQQRRQQSSPEQ